MLPALPACLAEIILREKETQVFLVLLALIWITILNSCCLAFADHSKGSFGRSLSLQIFDAAVTFLCGSFLQPRRSLETKGGVTFFHTSAKLCQTPGFWSKGNICRKDMYFSLTLSLISLWNYVQCSLFGMCDFLPIIPPTLHSAEDNIDAWCCGGKWRGMWDHCWLDASNQTSTDRNMRLATLLHQRVLALAWMPVACSHT